MKDKHIILLFALAAGALVAGTVFAAVVVLPESSVRHSGCRVEETRGAPVAPGTETTDTATEGGRSKAVRTLTHSVPAGSEADLLACVSTGAIALGISGDGRVGIEVTVVGWGGSPDAARAQARDLQPEVRAGSGFLAVVEPRRSFSPFGDHASMSVEVLVPPAMLLRADLSSGTGGLRIDGPRLAGLDASTGTGGVQLRPSYAGGSLDVSTGTGGIEARFPGLGNASFDFSTGTSGIRIAVPGDAAHGYDVDASTGTGGVRVELPDLDGESQRGSYEGATRGFASKPIQIAMDLSTGTGGITVTSV